MAMIAYCADDPGPAVGAPYSACTSVVWDEVPSALPGLTIEGAALIFGAVAVLWVIAYSARLFRAVINLR